MDKDLIRKRILNYLYAKNLEEGGQFSTIWEVLQELELTEEQLASNAYYLFEKDFIKGKISQDLYARGYYKITHQGIDFMEQGEQIHKKDVIQQHFHGNISNSTIITGQTITIDGSFNNIHEYLSENNYPPEFYDILNELKTEFKILKENIDNDKTADIGPIRRCLQKFKIDDKLFTIVAPILTNLISTVILGTPIAP